MKRTSQGFSLIELIVTLTIVAIAAAFAVPGFTTLIKDNQLVSQTNNMVTALNLARSEAVNRGSRVTVCSSATKAACGGASWAVGWIVFDDSNNNATVDAGETVIRVFDAIETNSTFAGSANVASYISYVGTGFSRLTTGASQSGTLVLCDARGISEGRAVILSNTGRPRAVTAAVAGAAAC